MNTNVYFWSMSTYRITILQRVLLISCLLLFGLHDGWTQNDERSEPIKLGFVFSGGGAKGIAHVGALMELEKAGIYPSYITGTSMGSIVGGLYAIGYDADALRRITRQIDWEFYFNDQLPRNSIPMEWRGAEEKYQLRFKVLDGKLAFPKGLVRGSKIELLLSELTAPAHGTDCWDAFPIPFRCIGANLETGAAKVFYEGSLAQAIRASMSIPSVFEPVVIEDSLYVDGGVVLNLPVEDALEMGADKIIAFDVSIPLYARDELGTVLDVMTQVSSYKLAESQKKQLAMADVVISPDMEGMSALDFTHIDTLLERGARAARAMLPEILDLVPESRRIPPPNYKQPIQDTLLIKGYSTDPASKRALSSLPRLIKLKTPGVYNYEDLQNKLYHLEGSRFYQSHGYELWPLDSNAYWLHLKVKPNQADYVGISANYDIHLKAGLLLNATVRNKILPGSALKLDVKVSEFPSAELTYQLATAGKPTAGANLGGRFNLYPGILYKDGERIDEFTLQHYQFSGHVFGSMIAHNQIELGAGWEKYIQNSAFLDSETEDLQLQQTFLEGRWLYDDRDRVFYTNKGGHIDLLGKFAFQGSITRSATDVKRTFNEWTVFSRLRISHFFPLGKRINLSLYGDGGWLARLDDNLVNRFYLGRPLPNEPTHVFFVGLDYSEQPANRYGILGFKLRHETWEDVFFSLIANYAYYELDRFEVGGTEMMQSFSSSDGSLWGVGLEAGIRTRIGPAWLRVEYNPEQEDVNAVLHMGYWF